MWFDKTNQQVDLTHLVRRFKLLVLGSLGKLESFTWSQNIGIGPLKLWFYSDLKGHYDFVADCS